MRRLVLLVATTGAGIGWIYGNSSLLNATVTLNLPQDSRSLTSSLQPPASSLTWSFADAREPVFDAMSMRVIFGDVVDRLVSLNFVVRTANAVCVSCPACGGHGEEVISFDYPDGTTRYYVPCPRTFASRCTPSCSNGGQSTGTGWRRAPHQRSRLPASGDSAESSGKELTATPCSLAGSLGPTAATLHARSPATLALWCSSGIVPFPTMFGSPASRHWFRSRKSHRLKTTRRRSTPTPRSRRSYSANPN
jgi:hypothetical protein